MLSEYKRMNNMKSLHIPREKIYIVSFVEERKKKRTEVEQTLRDVIE